MIDAKHGGKSTISKLQLTPTAEDDGEIYACRATNPLLETAVSDAVTLDVLCEYTYIISWCLRLSWQLDRSYILGTFQVIKLTLLT